MKQKKERKKICHFNFFLKCKQRYVSLGLIFKEDLLQFNARLGAISCFDNDNSLEEMWKVVGEVQFQDKHFTLCYKSWQALRKQLEIKTRNKTFSSLQYKAITITLRKDK